MKIFSWWGLFWALFVAGGLFLTYYSGGKEVISDIKTAASEDPRYWECDQDGNIRGIMLNNIDFENSEFLYLGLGVKDPKARFKRPIRRNNYQCLFYLLEDKECRFKFKIDNNNRLLLTLDIYDEFKCLVGKVKENHFILNLDCQFTWNMDDFGFEIVDSDFKVVVSLDYKPLNGINAQAVLPREKEILLFYSIIGDTVGNIQKVDYGDTEELKLAKDNLTPLFEYYGKDWFGKRASIN